MSSTCVQCVPAWSSLMSPIQTELVLNTHTVVTEMHQELLKLRREDAGSQNRVVSDTRAQSPPPPPRAFFGRDDLIERIVGLPIS